MKPKVRGVRVLTLMVLALLALPGCAGLAAAVPTITTVVQIVAAIEPVIAQIAAFVRSYFAQHPDPAAEQSVEDALARVAAKAGAIAALGQDTVDVDQGKLAAALADFQAAYSDLLAAVGKLPGVKVAHPGSLEATSSPPGTKLLVVPAPSAFGVWK